MLLMDNIPRKHQALMDFPHASSKLTGKWWVETLSKRCKSSSNPTVCREL